MDSIDTDVVVIGRWTQVAEARAGMEGIANEEDMERNDFGMTDWGTGTDTDVDEVDVMMAESLLQVSSAFVKFGTW